MKPPFFLPWKIPLSIWREKEGLIKTIGEAGGIGIAATRADIIDKLFNSFLIERGRIYL